VNVFGIIIISSKSRCFLRIFVFLSYKLVYPVAYSSKCLICFKINMLLYYITYINTYCHSDILLQDFFSNCKRKVNLIALAIRSIRARLVINRKWSYMLLGL
jgi:hypothetical protein